MLGMLSEGLSYNMGVDRDHHLSASVVHPCPLLFDFFDLFDGAINRVAFVLHRNALFCHLVVDDMHNDIHSRCLADECDQQQVDGSVHRFLCTIAP
jgi:hypothetical protein